jgi:member of the syntaxin family of t-SNAREs
VERRRRLVGEVGAEVDGMRAELLKTVKEVQDKNKAPVNNDVLPDPDSYEEEDDYAEFEEQRQVEMMHEQDEALDGVFRTVGNLRQQADDMGRELEEQTVMIKDVDDVADRVGNKLQNGLKKVGWVIKQNEGMVTVQYMKRTLILHQTACQAAVSQCSYSC